MLQEHVEPKIFMQINQFNSQMKEFENNFNKLAFDFNNSDNYIYEECSDLRRRIQLDKEETLLKLNRTMVLKLTQTRVIYLLI
jgi:hypothetical protein